MASISHQITPLVIINLGTDTQTLTQTQTHTYTQKSQVKSIFRNQVCAGWRVPSTASSSHMHSLVSNPVVVPQPVINVM